MNSNPPLSSVCVVFVSVFPTLWMLTDALGTTAPLGSETVPESCCESLARALNVPRIRNPKIARMRRRQEGDRKLLIMDQPVILL